MKETKKFISPGAWFSMEYPKSWFEFEDGEGSFLFYNPDVWDGNFRISAERGYSESYGEEVLKEEARHYKSYEKIDMVSGKALFGSSIFKEEENEYISYHWLYAVNDMFFECTFTTFTSQNEQVALEVLNSIVVRDLEGKYPSEVIPVRLSEVYRINNDFEWVVDFIKEKYAVPFQGEEQDIQLLDKLKNDDVIGKKKREQWQAVGITLAVILANEVEGLEWHTLIDGNREDPVLCYKSTQSIIDPMKLVWSKIKGGEEFTILSSYKEALEVLSEEGKRDVAL